MKWFSILASEIPSTPSFSSLEKGKKKNRIYAPPIKSSLSPFSVMKLSTRTFLTGTVQYICFSQFRQQDIDAWHHRRFETCSFDESS